MREGFLSDTIRACARPGLGIPLLVFCLIGFSTAAYAQPPSSALSSAESRMLDALLDRFRPLPAMVPILTGVFESAAVRMKAVRQCIDSLERSGTDEAEVLVRVGALRKEVRAIRDERNAFLAGFLSPAERLSLDSILFPPQPSIQHFGFHDRMKCLVCKTPTELDVPSGLPVPELQKNRL